MRAAGGGKRLIIDDRQESFSGHDAAHGVAYEDGANRGVDGRGGCAVGYFKVYDFILEPKSSQYGSFQKQVAMLLFPFFVVS